MRLGTRLLGSGAGGNSYLASVSDLVSALIFVFIIMLAVFAYRLAEVTEDWTSTYETRNRILEDIATRLGEAGIRVEVLADQGVLRLSDNAINFPSGREIPVTEHRGNVGFLARAIAEVAPCYTRSEESPRLSPMAVDDESRDHCQKPADPSSYSCPDLSDRLDTVLIEGHTDEVPVAAGNRFRNNLELSSMRAATVHRMIAVCEPQIEVLYNSQGHPVLSTSGYGHTRPPHEIPRVRTTTGELICASSSNRPRSSGTGRTWQFGRESGSDTGPETHESTGFLLEGVAGRVDQNVRREGTTSLARSHSPRIPARPCRSGRRERSEPVGRSQGRTTLTREPGRSVLASRRETPSRRAAQRLA